MKTVGIFSVSVLFAMEAGAYPVCPIGDAYCKALTHDSGSYCKYYQAAYDGAVCQGTDHPCSCEDKPDKPCAVADAMCQAALGDPNSYCKYYQDGPGGSVCYGSDLPCSCKPDGQEPSNECAAGDAFCKFYVGDASYCKFYQAGPGGSVCQGSEIECSCTDSCDIADKLCREMSGDDGSYCKYYQLGPHGTVCQGTDIPCYCQPNVHHEPDHLRKGSDVDNGCCPSGNAYCKHITGDEGSYCKYYNLGPHGSVCQGTDIPCSCDISCSAADTYCQKMTGSDASYCKYYQTGPDGAVCQGSDIPCYCNPHH